MERVKQLIVGSPLGSVAEGVRTVSVVLNAALFRRETAGTVAQDAIASRLVTRLCRPRMTFLDLGAHIGSVVAAVLRHDPSIHVIAVEAVPEKAQFLKSRFAGVEVIDCAVGEANGTAAFYVDLERSGYSSLSGSDGDGRRRIEVRVARLDELVTRRDVDVIKIDVEGAELSALRGGEGLVDACRPTIMFESAGEPNAELWRWFDARAYEIVVPNRVAHDGVGLGLDGFMEAHAYPRRATNYFAIARERRVAVRDAARAILGVRA